MHNTQGRRVRRGVAVAASGALVAGLAAAVTAGTTASAEATKVRGDFTYTCKSRLGSHQVPVTTRIKLPETVQAGQHVHKRAVRMRLAMPDALRDKATGDPIDAVAAKARSKDAALRLKANDRFRAVPVKRLRAAKAPVPTADPWSIAAKGKLRGFRVPPGADAGTKAVLRMPKSFTVKVALFDADGDKKRARLSCTADGKRKLAAMTVRKAPSRLRTTVKPDRIVADETRARAHVRVNTTGKATGRIVISERGDRLAVGKLEGGHTRVRLPRFDKPGQHALTIRYAGNESVRADVAKKRVRVFRH